MAITFDKTRSVRLVDRTLPEIVNLISNKKRLDIIYFCWLLKDIGVDVFEIDRNILYKIGKIPSGLSFLFRINEVDDVEECVKSGIKECVISSDVLKEANIVEMLKNNNISITAEFRVENIKDFKRLKRLKAGQYFNFIDKLRLDGLNMVVSSEWTEKLKSIKYFLNKDVDICSGNKYSNGTAATLEGIMEGADSVTVSFLGFGRNGGYAPLEEVLMASKILIKPGAKADLTSFPRIAEYFTKLTGINIPNDKSIVGKDIFKYQSGIHADGIKKNSLTYEPHDPSAVGLERGLTIGKHSGGRAVQQKLKELGLKCRMEEVGKILEFIREKSVRYRRDLFDDEIVEIFKNRNIAFDDGGWL